MNKKLIITADDYGVWSNIDRGIRKCATIGIIDNIDIMVTQGDYSKTSVKKLMSLNNMKIKRGELTLGLHLSLSCGIPQYIGDADYLKAATRRAKIKVTNTYRYEFLYPGGVKMIEKIADLVKNHKEALKLEMIAQYERFKEITGMEPSQISSHMGVYNANKEIYDVLNEFCQSKNIPMRCPTLISMESGLESKWTKPKQKLLPEDLIIFLTGMEGKAILNWIRTGQRTAYDEDRNKGLIGRDYFIEHFFKNGSIENLNKIIKNVQNTGDYSYEMVVHPVASPSINGIPTGVTKLGFSKRYDEYLTLLTDEAREIVNSYQSL